MDSSSEKTDMQDTHIFKDRDIDVAAQLTAGSDVIVDPEAAARVKSVITFALSMN